MKKIPYFSSIFCFSCYHIANPKMRGALITMCTFVEAWIGTCKEENVKGQEFCEKHIGQVCEICGQQATFNCDATFQFVCGTPLCNDPRCKEYHQDDHEFGPRHLWSKVKPTREQEIREITENKMLRSYKYWKKYNHLVDYRNFMTSSILLHEIKSIADTDLFEYIKSKDFFEPDYDTCKNSDEFHHQLSLRIYIYDMMDKFDKERVQKNA